MLSEIKVHQELVFRDGKKWRFSPSIPYSNMSGKSPEKGKIPLQDGVPIGCFLVYKP